MTDNNKPNFYVVQFVMLPFEGIDDYVCVPRSWIQAVSASAEKAFVAYPQNEDPYVTKYRVKKKEKFNKDWNYYIAVFKYESNTYDEAEQWITKTNKYRPLVEKASKTSETQSGSTLDKKLHIVNRNHSSKFNDNARKPLPKQLLKRPARSYLNKQLIGKSSSTVITDGKRESNPGFSLNKKLHSFSQNHPSKFNNNRRKSLKQPASLSLKKQLDGNQMKLSDAAQSSSAVVTDDKTQSMDSAQIEEGAAASIEIESTKRTTLTQRAEQNTQALNLPVIDVNDPSEVIVIDEENDSQDMNKADKNESQSHLVSNTPTHRTEQNIQGPILPVIDLTGSKSSEVIVIDEEKYSQSINKQNRENSESHLDSNTTRASMSSEDPPNLAKQTTWPNQYNNKEHNFYSSSFWKFKPGIDNVRSVANVHIDHELLNHEIANNIQSTSYDTSVKKFTQLYDDINGVRSLKSAQTSVENEIHPLNINRDLAVAARNHRSSLMDHIASSSARSGEEQMSVVSVNHSQDGLPVQETQTEKRKKQIGPLYSGASRFEKTQYVPKTNAKLHDTTFVDPLKASNIANQGKHLTSFYQNSYQPTYQKSIQQDLIRESIESDKYAASSKRIASTGLNSTISSSPLYLNSELPQQRLSQLHQQDVQIQQQLLNREQRYTCNITTQGNNLINFHQNPYFRQNPYEPTCQYSFQREYKDNNKCYHRPNSPTLRKTPYIRPNSRYSSIPLYPTAAEIPQQEQSQPNQQDFQQQLQMLIGEQRYHSNIATQAENLMASHLNTYHPTYQNSFQHDLTTECIKSNKNDHQLNSPNIRKNIPNTGPNSTFSSIPLLPSAAEIPQKRQSQQDLQPQLLQQEPRLQSLQDHLSVVNNIIQECLKNETPSPNHRVNTVAHTVKNNKEISNHGMSTDDAPIQTTNNFGCNEIASGSKCVERPVIAQNSTFSNYQTKPRVVLGKQMLNNLTALLAQMSHTMHVTRDMYKILQPSLCDITELYDQFLGVVKDATTRFPINNASLASNLKPEVSKSPVEGDNKVPQRANSGYNN